MVTNLVQIFDDGAHWLDRNNIPNVRAQVAMNLHKMNNWHPWQLKKIKIPGAVLKLPAIQHCRFGQFGPILR